MWEKSKTFCFDIGMIGIGARLYVISKIFVRSVNVKRWLRMIAGVLRDVGILRFIFDVM